MLDKKLTFRLLIIALLLAFIVIQLGAFTRLKDAGLGCPDWPGCYGKLIVPKKQQLTLAFAQYKDSFNAHKAWAEMIHRYAVASLSLLILALVALLLQRRHATQQSIKIAFLLLALLFFQAMLGKWTVTLQLHPLVVLGHLWGGLSLLALLWYLALQSCKWLTPQLKPILLTLRPWVLIGMVIVLLQITLGGWTSSNYAAFVCADFPRCQEQWWPLMHIKEGFHIDWNVSKNFAGGLLSSEARTAIQTMHRLGALLTTLYLLWLSWKIHAMQATVALKRLSYLIIITVCLQFSLGVLNVLWYLPLLIAMAHNGMAAVLLLLLITLYSWITPANNA